MLRGFLTFCGLALSIGVVWAVLSYLEERSQQHEDRLVGALAFVEAIIEASQGPSTELYSPSIEPHAKPNFWALSGIAARQDSTGGKGHLPYSAVLESTCLPYGNPDCWRIESLTIDHGPIEIDTGNDGGSLQASDPIDSRSPEAAKEFEPSGKPKASPVSSRKSPSESVVPVATGMSETPSSVDLKEPADPAPTASSEDALVSSIQVALKELGFDPGPSDGRLGPRTTSAIEAYQRGHGLHADGQPTKQLLNHIEKQLKATEEEG